MGLQFHAIPIRISIGAGVPYSIRKAKCKQTDGDRGGYVLSYTDNKGKKHRNCHTSRKKAKAQIAAIEMPEGIEEGWVPIAARITEILEEELAQLAGSFRIDESSGDPGFSVGDQVRPLKISREMMIHNRNKVMLGTIIRDNDDGTYDVEWEPLPGRPEVSGIEGWEPEDRIERRIHGGRIRLSRGGR